MYTPFILNLGTVLQINGQLLDPAALYPGEGSQVPKFWNNAVTCIEFARGEKNYP